MFPCIYKNMHKTELPVLETNFRVLELYQLLYNPHHATFR